MPYPPATPTSDQPGRDPEHLKLLSSTAAGLPQALVARVEGHLAHFTEHMRDPEVSPISAPVPPPRSGRASPRCSP